MTTRFSSILSLCLLGGPLAILEVGGCSSETTNSGTKCPPGFKCTSLDGSPGAILESGVGASPTGTGGASGVPKATPLGKACVQDTDCKSGLTCVTASGNALGGGGPPGGVCTVQCDPNGDGSECTAFDPSAACVVFDNAATMGFCMQGCTPGQITGQKCQGRVNFACDSRGFCTPTCTGTGNECGSRKCDLGTGLCVDSVTGTLPVGSTCNTKTMPDACRGNCERFSGGAGHVDTMCTGRCQLGGTAGCGVDVASSTTFDAFCIFGASDAGTGDLGACAQLCDCNSDCLDKQLVCSAFPDQLVTLTGRQGVCASPYANEAGLDPGIICASTPDASKPPPADAGKPKPPADAGTKG